MVNKPFSNPTLNTVPITDATRNTSNSERYELTSNTTTATIPTINESNTEAMSTETNVSKLPRSYALAEPTIPREATR